jgi:hypothetical protein
MIKTHRGMTRLLRRQLPTTLALVGGLGYGCSTLQRPPASTPPTRSAVDTMPRIAQPHETMLSNPRDLTIVRLGILHGYVYRYWEANQRIPQELAALNEVEHEGTTAASVDGWGRIVRYDTSDSVYEFRSAGEDGQFDTADDPIVVGVAGRSRPCRIQYGDGRVFDFSEEAPFCPSMR